MTPEQAARLTAALEAYDLAVIQASQAQQAVGERVGDVIRLCQEIVDTMPDELSKRVQALRFPKKTS